MKRIMCYCLAISMIPLHITLDTDGECMEPQLLIKETNCGYDNMTSLTMYTFNKESPVISFSDGCDVNIADSLNFNNTFYFECDTEINCFETDLKQISRDIYYLECEEVNMLTKETVTTEHDYEIITEMGVVINKTTTEFDDTVTNATASSSKAKHDYGSTTEMGVFINEITTEFNDIRTDATASSSKVYDLTNISTTEHDSLLKNSPPNSSEADMFSTEMTTELGHGMKDDHANTSEVDQFRNESTTEHENHLNNVESKLAETDLPNNKTAKLFKVAKENSSDSSNIFAILGYSVTGIGATVGIAFGAYKLKNVLQSGSYLIPDAPNPPSFIELA